MEKIKVKIKLVHPDAKIPIYGTQLSAGCDLYAPEDVTIPPGEIKKIPLGIKLEVPPGYTWKFWDRGGMGAKGIHHFGGLFDEDYRGENILTLFNSTKEPYKIERGDRIIQVIFTPYIQADFETTEELSDTERGEGRYHSTGK